ncbi:MAG: hypothetical protein ACYDA4_06250 [Ignavibacteriaceae bacterium]
MGIYDWAKGPTFDFIREEIMEYCDKLPSIEDQIRYLAFILKEWKNNPPELDQNIRRTPAFGIFIQNEIDYRQLLLETSSNSTHGVVKITGRVPEVVRIFEAMKSSEIISLKTEASQIGRIFFNKKIDVKTFAAKYNARKKDLIEDERSTTNKSLFKFVTNLIEISYKAKPDMLDKISEQIERVRRK